MSSFSPTWLGLREPVDHRSRNPQLGHELSAYFQARTKLSVVDLGCGTGSNLRATAPLLSAVQRWTLVDYDTALLDAARQELARWADTSVVADGELALEKDGRKIRIAFHHADLSRELDAILSDKPDLVTASALFDLCSASFIKSFAQAVAARRCVFYTVLTYNGIQRWTPRRPGDNAMVAAFHAHQMTDKGFGPSAGPTAPAHLADAFRLAGYTVREDDSPWCLGQRDQRLLAELAAGFTAAVRETGRVEASDIDRWTKVVHTGAEVGHTDTLALPA